MNCLIIAVALVTVAVAAPIDPATKQEKTVLKAKANDEPMLMTSTIAWTSTSEILPEMEHKDEDDKKKKMHDEEMWTSSTMMTSEMPEKEDSDEDDEKKMKDEGKVAMKMMEMSSTFLPPKTTMKMGEMNEPPASTVAVPDLEWTSTIGQYWQSTTIDHSDEDSSDSHEAAVVVLEMGDHPKKMTTVDVISTTMLPPAIEEMKKKVKA